MLNFSVQEGETLSRLPSHRNFWLYGNHEAVIGCNGGAAYRARIGHAAIAGIDREESLRVEKSPIILFADGTDELAMS